MLHIARLCHKAINHAVKSDVVILASPHQIFHPLTVQRRHIWQKLDGDGPIFQFHQDCIFEIFGLCIGH